MDISSKFPFESRFVDVKGSEIHYIDVGEGIPVLFLHGNPTSSYLWRNIIPHLAGKARCIAPDLIGMGKSGKPDIDYGFRDSYEYLKGFIERLDLKNIILVLHDWGSGLGFHYAHEHEANIKGIAFMEALYRPIDWGKLPMRMKVAMTMMRMPSVNWLMLGVANIFVKRILPNGIVRTLSKTEMEYYAAPFPSVESRKPVRKWPREIPIKGLPKYTMQAVQAYHEWLKETEIPKICFYANPGMLITIDETDWIKRHFPNITMSYIGKGLHFVQEDHPHTIGEGLAKWLEHVG